MVRLVTRGRHGAEGEWEATLREQVIPRPTMANEYWGQLHGAHGDGIANNEDKAVPIFRKYTCSQGIVVPPTYCPSHIHTKDNEVG